MSQVVTRIDMLVIMVLFYTCSLLLFGICYLDNFQQQPRPALSQGVPSSWQQAKENQPASSSIDPIVAHVRRVQEECGQLCDLNKPITPGPFMGSVTAKLVCKNLFSSDFLDRPSQIPPMPWQDIPKELKDLYSYGGRIEEKDYFLNNAMDGGGRKEAQVFTEKYLQERVSGWLNGSPQDTYGWGSVLVDNAANKTDVEGKTVLVIGTQDPWLEAVLIARKPKKIITVEYGHFTSEHPLWEIILPEEFRSRFLSGKLPQFDLVFSYSSVEHSGLGRYGDTLNPFGDIIAIARAWCVSGPQAKLLLAVPTGMQGAEKKGGKDILQFNAHRIYGPVQYPFLVTNWRFIWPTEPAQREAPSPVSQMFQPVYVFEKL